MGALWALIEPWISWLCIALIGGWTVYAGLIKPVVKPNPTTTNVQSGGVSYTYDFHPTFGCMRVPEQMKTVNATNKGDKNVSVQK